MPENPIQENRCAEVGHACRATIEAIMKNCPNGRERSLAVTKLEEALFWAAAAIEREGKVPDAF